MAPRSDRDGHQPVGALSDDRSLAFTARCNRAVYMAFVSDKLRRYSKTQIEGTCTESLKSLYRLYRADLPHVEKGLSAKCHGHSFASDS